MKTNAREAFCLLRRERIFVDILGISVARIPLHMVSMLVSRLRIRET
jgi:hypothetical protein